MPGLRLHTSIARDLADELASRRIDAVRGAYYLGATTPDIRALTRWDREHTHFFRLSDFEHQSGVDRLFEEHPDLRDAARLDDATAAFMAGYISHLVMDEDYITEIYRPLFGERSALRDDEMADVLDKLLQWDVERADCEDAAKMEDIRDALAQEAVQINIDFIGGEDLRQWRDLSLEVMSQPATVDRLVRFLGRRLPAVQVDDEEKVARFAENVPALIARAWEHVGEERVREYMSGARKRALERMKEYLS